ncbi:MAG: hypothetical protein WD342_08210 [Verrucomicrobiales bacterium]
MKPSLFILSVTLAALLPVGCATRESAANANVKPYPFDTCAVIDRPLTAIRDKPLRRVHEGQEVLFCCHPCVKAFDANPEPYMAKLRAAQQSGTALRHSEEGEAAAVAAAAQMGE